MRRTNNQLRLIDNDSTESAKLTDTPGNPSESYHPGHMAAVRREWRHEFSLPQVNDVNAFELTVREIISIERRVRRELYP